MSVSWKDFDTKISTVIVYTGMRGERGPKGDPGEKGEKGDPGIGAIGVFHHEEFTLTAPQIAAKTVTLSQTPGSPTAMKVTPRGCIEQEYGLDFTVSGNVLSWNSLGMDGLLIAGDILEVDYFT